MNWQFPLRMCGQLQCEAGNKWSQGLLGGNLDDEEELRDRSLITGRGLGALK